jgi:predicted transcriptional regulator
MRKPLNVRQQPKAMRLPLPEDLYERLRVVAFEERKSKTRIVQGALRRELDRLERRWRRSRGPIEAEASDGHDEAP